MTTKIKSLTDLWSKIKSGKINGSELIITLDNDYTGIQLGGDRWNEDNELVFRGGGYDDLLEVYQLAFPDADIDWC